MLRRSDSAENDAVEARSHLPSIQGGELHSNLLGEEEAVETEDVESAPKQWKHCEVTLRGCRVRAHTVNTAAGDVIDVPPVLLSLTALLLVAGGCFLTGLASIGVGEVSVTVLAAVCAVPARVATATSVCITTLVVAAASFASIAADGAGAVPWNLVIWTCPGVIVGAQLGVRLGANGKAGRGALALLFAVLGGVMLCEALSVLGVFAET